MFELSLDSFLLYSPISHTLLQDPVSLHGQYFSRVPLETWVIIHKVHPITKKPAFLHEIQNEPKYAELVRQYVAMLQHQR